MKNTYKLKYRFYRWFMLLAHRYHWHHMHFCHPDGDTMLVCSWCGIRVVVAHRKTTPPDHLPEIHKLRGIYTR